MDELMKTELMRCEVRLPGSRLRRSIYFPKDEVKPGSVLDFNETFGKIGGEGGVNVKTWICMKVETMNGEQVGIFQEI